MRFSFNPGKYALPSTSLIVLTLAVASPARAFDDCLTEVAHSPRGEISSIAADGTLLVYGSGTGFIIEDITDPRQPVFLAELGLGSDIADVEIVGAIGYAVSADRLHIMDLSEPAAPREVGRVGFSHTASAIEVEGQRVWVAGGNGVSTVDVANPSNPIRTWQTSCTYLCSVRDLSLEYPFIHVIGDEYWILEAEAPRFQYPVGGLQISGWEIETTGDKALIRSGRVVEVVDISDERHPVEVGSVRPTSSPRDIQVVPNGVVVVCTRGLSALDIESPAGPLEVGYVGYFADWEGDKLEVIACMESQGFIASATSIQSVDLTDPAHPDALGFTGNPSSWRVAASDRVTVAIYRDPPLDPWGSWAQGQREKQMSVHQRVDNQLVEVGFWETEGEWEYIYDVEMVDQVAFVATWRSITSVDLNDPSNPVTLARGWSGSELTVDGDRLYFAHSFGERALVFGSFDVSDPTQFTDGHSVTLDDAWPVIPGPTDIDARGNTVIIGTSDGFRIVDVADPLAPFEVIHVNLNDGWFDRAVLLLDGIALVSTSVGVTVFDVRDRQNPVPIGYWGSAVQLFEFRDRVVATSPQGAVYLLDLQDPTNPVATDFLVQSKGAVTGASVSWPIVVTAHGPNGLTVSGMRRSCFPPRSASSRKVP